MVTQSILKPIELRIVREVGKEDVFFWQSERRSKLLILSGLEEEEFYVSGNPIPESLSPWVEILILEQNTEGKKSFDMSLKWQGLKSEEVEILNDLKNRFRLSVNGMTNVTMDLTSLFNSNEWVITLST
jgi:hypothetical protein